MKPKLNRLLAFLLPDVPAAAAAPQVGLRGINGLYLFEVEHTDGRKAKVVDQDTVLEKGDVLWFAGGLGWAFLHSCGP
jgi:hypothetical protein